MITNQGREVIMVCSDFHVPFHDVKSLAALYEFIRYIKPSKIIIHEVEDFYGLSKYSKDPARKDDWQAELDMGIEIRATIRRCAPRAEIIELESNHYARLKKYVWDVAPAFNSIRALQPENLLGLKKLNIQFKEYYIYKDILFKHGSLCRAGSSMTAKAELMREGMSGASGHTHRLGMHFKRQRGGEYVWIECGCLCQLENVEYIDGTADWQQGFGLFFFEKDSNRFTPGLVPIIKHKIYFDNKLFFEKTPGEVNAKIWGGKRYVNE
jgi:hypothetical protein